MGDTPDPAVFAKPVSESPSTRLNTLVTVGAYAVTPIWEDGHDAGIYRWSYLRALCPCEECRNPSTGRNP
jgi:DUF971 family protein